MLNCCLVCLLKKNIFFLFMTFSVLSLDKNFVKRESEVFININTSEFINNINLQSIRNTYLDTWNFNFLFPYQFNIITHYNLLFNSVQEQSYVYERTMSSIEQRLSHKFNSIEHSSRRNNIYLNIILYLFIYYFYWNFFQKIKRSYTRRSLIPITQYIIKKKEKIAFKNNTHIEYINESTEKIILSGLLKFENKYTYLHKSITLGKLATELNTNVKYLSIVIKKHKAENFNHYINELRIKYIVEKLTYNEDFLKYKISYLSDLCGYSSPAAFTKSFIEIMGQTPSEFIKSLNK